MPNSSKKLMSAQLLTHYQDIFRCPICFVPMRMDRWQSLVCRNGHCFDVAKQGYVNFLTRSHKTKYGRSLFEARRAVCESGFFDPLHAVLGEKISRGLHSGAPAKILDAGCGEGFHLVRLQDRLAQTADLLLVGADISKDAIRCAAGGYSRAIWCTADVANSPFADRQFDVLLNLLAPANYAEFRRVATGGGTIVKVVPERGYLREIRELLYDEAEPKRPQSGMTGRELFQAHFELTNADRIIYRVDLDDSTAGALLDMSPLVWGGTEDRLRKVRQADLRTVTVDLTVLWGKNR